MRKIIINVISSLLGLVIMFGFFKLFVHAAGFDNGLLVSLAFAYIGLKENKKW